LRGQKGRRDGNCGRRTSDAWRIGYFQEHGGKGTPYFGGKVILGFAGSVTDAFALTERFEGMLNKFSGNLMRSAVELAELWRSDKIGRKLDAMMITADENTLLILSGTGEVIEPDEGVCAIGSGGNYALAAARALYQETDYDAPTIATKALKIASEICVFTNDNIRLETVGEKVKEA